MAEREKGSANQIALETRVLELERRFSLVGHGHSLVVAITTFAPEPYEVLKDIRAVVQPSDDEFVATFFDANVSAGGCNDVEAVDNLKDLLISRFEFLDTYPPEKLGPGPAKQIAVLREFIRRRTWPVKSPKSLPKRSSPS